MTRPVLTRLAALATGGVLLAGCGGGGPPSQTLRVGIVCGGIGLAALTIDEGRLEGVTAEKVCFESGSDAVAALSGGSIDAFVGAGEHIIRNRAKGLDVRGYAVFSDTPPYSLVSPPSAPVRSVAELAGGTVAVTSPGSLSDTELQRAAAEAGIDYAGLRVIGAGGGATMRATIEKGGAAAGMVTEPTLTTVVDAGFVVTWAPDFPYVALAVIARESRVADKRDALAAYLQGALATRERAVADEAAAVTAARAQAPQLDEAVLTKVVGVTIEEAPAGLVVDEGVYGATVDLLGQVGQVESGQAAPYSEAFDFSLLQAS